jgi:uncharacterized repeat protein (TIGR03803 family)
MARPSLRIVISLYTVLFTVLGITAFDAMPARAQNYCGPVTVINFNNSNGAYPGADVSFDSQGNMYGTTSGGGTLPGGGSGYGTIWKYTSSAGLTTLFIFTGSSSPSNNGYNAHTPLLIDTQGNLYGATAGGGNSFNLSNSQSGYGTLFKLSSSGQFTELHQFSGPDGLNPFGSLVLDTQGNLWGTTIEGGSSFNNQGNNGSGTVFTYSGGTVTNPVSFNASNGEYPNGGMAADGTNYYGTTSGGGANSFGTLFQYNSTTGQLTTLFNFNRNPNGSSPDADVIYDGKGHLYGTTSAGGSHSSASNSCCGTIWKYTIGTGTLTTLASFDGDTVPADGIYPTGGVTLDANGDLLGTTNQGGTFGDGIVYELSSTGVMSTLVTFSGPNGQAPGGQLVVDSSGNLWGVTNSGGTSGYGSVYKLTPNGGGGACGGGTVSSLTFNPSSLQNGAASTGTVTLSAPAPSGGSVVGLSDDNPSFLVIPSTVTVPAGATSATFQSAANNGFVLSNTLVTVTATIGNSTTQGSVTITTGVAVKSIIMNPTAVVGGNKATGTVTLTTPAPSGSNEVLISTNNNNPADPNAVILPITVEIPAGQTSANFSFGTRPVASSFTAPIYAQAGGVTVSTSLTLNPGGSSATLSSVTLNPTSVTGGSKSTGTVTLSSAAPSGGTVVSLSSNNSSAAVPSSVTVTSGSTSANFTVTTTSVNSATTATITGTLGSTIRQASLTINPPASVTISSLTLNPTTVTGGNSSTGTVTLSSAAPSGGTVVSLSSNSSGASGPSSVTVASGLTSATFTVTTTSVSTALTATITATLGSSSQIASLIINPTSTLSSLTLNPTNVSGGNNSKGTVTLSVAAPSGGATVTLFSSNTSLATVPSSITLQPGQARATFTVTTHRVSSNTRVVIRATYSRTMKSATLTVTSSN